MKITTLNPLGFAPKVTRKALSEEDQRRLVEEALKEMDFSALSAGASSN